MAEPEPREMTTQEVRRDFINKIKDSIDKWEKSEVNTRAKLEGVVRDILDTLDRGSGKVPGFNLVPVSDSTDRDFFRECGENWLPVTEGVQIMNNIAGLLVLTFNDNGASEEKP